MLTKASGVVLMTFSPSGIRYGSPLQSPAMPKLRETIDMLSVNGASSIPNVIPKRSNPAVAAKAPSKRLQSPSASNGPSNGVRATQNRDEVSISPQTQNILNQGLNSLNQQIKQQMLNSAGQQMRNVAKQIMQKDYNQENSDFNNFRKNADTANLAAANSLPQSILPLISGR